MHYNIIIYIIKCDNFLLLKYLTFLHHTRIEFCLMWGATQHNTPSPPLCCGHRVVTQGKMKIYIYAYASFNAYCS